MNIENIVLVYGSETVLGSRIVASLGESEHNCVPRPSDYYASDVVKNIHRDIRSKRPSVVINCLIDPDSGYYPLNPTERFIAPTHAMIQQCRVVGSRYIYCGSARVYGQQESLANRLAYTEFDPWLANCEDPWRAICQAVEASLWQQVSNYNFQAKAETHANFECYCLRFGHILSLHDLNNRPVDAYSLRHCLRSASESSQNMTCGRPSQRLSPIDVNSAVQVILELLTKRPRPVSGTYNIASTDTTTIDQFFSYVSMLTGNAICVGPMCQTASNVKQVYGVDADQSVDPSFWLKRAKTKLPTWRDAVAAALRNSEMSHTDKRSRNRNLRADSDILNQ